MLLESKPYTGDVRKDGSRTEKAGIQGRNEIAKPRTYGSRNRAAPMLGLSIDGNIGTAHHSTRQPIEQLQLRRGRTYFNIDSTDIVKKHCRGYQPYRPDTLRLHNLLQRHAAANHQRRALELHQLFSLEFREEAADCLARRADDFGDLFVGKRQLDLRGAVILCALA